MIGSKPILVYMCKHCGENDRKQFYSTNKTNCKKCTSLRITSKYNDLDADSKEVYKDRVKHRQDNNIIQFRWLSAKNRCKKNGLEFSIDKEYLDALWRLQEGRCYYSNIAMIAKRSAHYSISLDRLDNSLGYIEGNVVLCCSIVNIMKNTLGIEEFRSIVKELYVNM